MNIFNFYFSKSGVGLRNYLEFPLDPQCAVRSSLSKKTEREARLKSAEMCELTHARLQP